MSDLIDRQDAIELCLEALKNILPFVQPERISDPDKVYAELIKVYNIQGLPDEVYSIIGDLMLKLTD